MKNLRESWKLIALLAVAAIVSLGYVVRSRAFTLIELLHTAAVEVEENQKAMVTVSNVTADKVELSVYVYAGNGTLVASSTNQFLEAGQTFKLPYTNTSGGNQTIRADVHLSANAAVADLQTFDVATGQLVVIALPAIQLTAE